MIEGTLQFIAAGIWTLVFLAVVGIILKVIQLFGIDKE